jgi:hypothetical protein
LFRDRWKSLFAGAPGGARLKDRFGSSASGNGQAGAPGAGESSRVSRGLEQYLLVSRDRPGLSVLDLGGASQANVMYLAGLGQRIYTEDLMMSVDELLENERYRENPGDIGVINSFLDRTLGFPDAYFGGALVWDALQFMPEPLLDAVIERLFRVVSPGSPILALFHSFERANERAEPIPMYSYRIQDQKTLHLTPRGVRKPAHQFNNRSLERLFQRFDSLKFFLTKDHLREILVRR